MKKMMISAMIAGTMIAGTMNGNPIPVPSPLTNYHCEVTNNSKLFIPTIGFVGGYTEVVTNYSKTFISLDDLNDRLRSYIEEATVVERTMIRYTINGVEDVTCVNEKNLSRRQRDVKVESILKTNNWIDLGNCSIGITSNKVQADVMTSSCWMVNLFDGKTNQFSISPQFQPTPVALGK